MVPDAALIARLKTLTWAMANSEHAGGPSGFELIFSFVEGLWQLSRSAPQDAWLSDLGLSPKLARVFLDVRSQILDRMRLDALVAMLRAAPSAAAGKEADAQVKALEAYFSDNDALTARVAHQMAAFWPTADRPPASTRGAARWLQVYGTLLIPNRVHAELYTFLITGHLHAALQKSGAANDALRLLVTAALNSAGTGQPFDARPHTAGASALPSLLLESSTPGLVDKGYVVDEEGPVVVDRGFVSPPVGIVSRSVDGRFVVASILQPHAKIGKERVVEISRAVFRSSAKKDRPLDAPEVRCFVFSAGRRGQML